jgi:hypothetical protein
MEFTWDDALKSGGVSASTIAILGIAYKIISKFCGHRLRSECCGREGTVGVSVEEIPRAPRSSLEHTVAVEVAPSARPSPVLSPAATSTSPPTLALGSPATVV